MIKLVQRITGRTTMPSLKRYKNRIEREKSIMAAHSTHSEEHKADYSLLDNYVQNFRNSGGLKHQYQIYKLWCLQEILNQNKPKSILELGSGSSTLVFGRYVKENNLRLLSIDEDQKWAKNTLSLLGDNRSDTTEVIQKEKICRPSRTPIEIRYDTDIKENFDLVFIDGPSLNIGKGKINEAVNSNIFDLPQPPQIIVVDVRKSTAHEIANRYGDIYDIHLSDLFTDKPVSKDYNYFSIFYKK